MSTLTKEWLQQTIAEMEEHRDMFPGDLDDDHGKVLASLRIALASLEADPVCVIDQSNLDYLNAGSDADVWPASRAEMGDVLLYRSVPPAPVSVPDFGALTKCIVQRLVDYGAADDDAIASAEEFVYNACRAAMLQGAEHVTKDCKLPFEQWLSQQTGTIDVECGCVMTEVFFHWLRVAYEAGNYPVIPDGWVMVPVELTPRMITKLQQNTEIGSYIAANWAGAYGLFQKFWDEAIAAAPQQEAE